MKLQDLNEDMILYVASFLKRTKLLFEKLYISIEKYFLKLTCKNFYNYLNTKIKYKPYYNVNMIKTLFFNEIAKIGNEKMFEEFKNVELYKAYNEVIINACIYNRVNILEWYYNKNLNFNSSKNTVSDYIGVACFYGHTTILDWFHSKQIFDYSDNAIVFATRNNHINIIYWFITHPEYKFICNYNAIIHASTHGNIEMLELLIKYDNQLTQNQGNHSFVKMYCYSIKMACENGHAHVLEWFKVKFNAVYCGCENVKLASENNHINILDWYKNNNCYIYCNPAIINLCSDKVQNWFNDYIIEKNMN
jgi:ankyrin repeat protein